MWGSTIGPGKRDLHPSDTVWQFNPESIGKLSIAIQRVQLRNGLLPNYGERFNPLPRCIVRRTRAYLEATINPTTGGYFLPKVTVKLFGEEDQDALGLGGYLRENGTIHKQGLMAFSTMASDAGTSTFDALIHTNLDVSQGLLLGGEVGQKIVARGQSDGAN